MDETNKNVFIRSVSNESKTRSDTSLKNKLDKETKNRKKSRLTRIDHEIKSETDNVSYEEPMREHEENFILEKFLIDAVSMKEPKLNHNQKGNNSNNSTIFIKPPIPLPRKTKGALITKDNNIDSSSNRTYSITSPKDESVRDLDIRSNSSKATYSIEKNKITKDSDDDSNSSGATYNVYKHKKIENIPVGDIVIHNSPTLKNPVKIIQEKKNLNKSVPNQNEIKTGTINNTINEKQHSKTIDTESTESNTTPKLTVEPSQKTKTIQKPRKTNLIQTINEKSPKKYSSSELCSPKSEDIELQTISTARKRRQINKKPHKIVETQVKDEQVYKYEDFIGIVVYKTDKLQLNSLINRPCVKIHIVDSVTGEYLKRSKTMNDNAENTVEIEYIKTLITKPYNLQEKRSLIPHWDELLTIEEDFDYLLNYKNPVIIFFEILDFLSFSAASLKYHKEGTNSGWHKVAWAFLKITNTSGHLNLEKKIRLQLFKPKKYVPKKSARECVLFEWWTKGNYIKYPSTLHVNIKRVKAAISINKKVAESQIDILNEAEEETTDCEKNNTEEKDICEETPEEGVKKNKWRRIVSQFCKIPNKIEVQVKTGKKGCLMMKFSNNGLMLAYGNAENNQFPIIIYSLSDQTVYSKFSKHQALIYDFHWTADDKYLISASADWTVYIWDVINKNPQPLQILPHPSFVYCVCYNQTKNQILTGCYDQVIRIWSSTNHTIDSDYELVQELDGHMGYITSLCICKDEMCFYSADSVGMIVEWSCNETVWSLKRTFKHRELCNTVINNIILHPGGSRLFISCRDSIHRMMDLSVGCIIQWYKGALNFRVQTTSCLTPCGNFIFAPSEDGTVCIWNSDTGILQATYTPYSSSTDTQIIPHCIQYHPYDHMIAISHHGSTQPILLAVYEKSCTGLELQLKNCTDFNEKSAENKKIIKNNVPKKSILTKGGKQLKHNKNINLEVIIEKLDDVLISARKDK